MSRTGFLTVGLVFAAVPLGAQSVLAGRVREDSTGRPLAGVEVVIVGSERRTLTDASGRYVLNMLPDGRRQVLFRSVGFRPVQEWVVLGRADTVWANPMLVAQTVQLDPITVTGKPDAPRGLGLEAFEERRKLGFGKFLDSSTLRRNEHQRLPALLDRLQGIGFTIVDKGVVAVSRRRFGPMGEPCYMSVVLDGTVIYSSSAPGLGGGGNQTERSPPDLKMFDVASLTAVELYRGAGEVPIEFGGAGAACGVLVLWTRRN
ncbi:MAG TPA: carboxypeptidase regulatory-like domain-containing protein [Gemmatimonadales bacterium]|nr:carboxypeptidase regulatory-like domain-containing protein [Gemmatimonadales bacterium]